MVADIMKAGQTGWEPWNAMAAMPTTIGIAVGPAPGALGHMPSLAAHR